jgi:hypothetical protein
MMQTQSSSHATADRRTFTQEFGRRGGADLTPLTPAQRIALTIALLNRGLDLMDGFARTSLAGCARVAVRGHHVADSAEYPAQDRASNTRHFLTR